MNAKKLSIFFVVLLTALFLRTNGQNTATDSVDVKTGDRNVLLNAESANQGPRNVNIGLPASVGGTTVLENGLPVVYFFWPEMPYRAWRMDGTINNVQLYDLGRTGIYVGDVGFSVSTFDNLGTDELAGNIGLKSNHFGLLNGTFNVSGPLAGEEKNNWKFSVGGFFNFDPGTYPVKDSKNPIDRYYNDQTMLFKAALTKEYSFGSGTGSVSLFYKFADSKGMGTAGAPYVYHLDGSVSEIDGFKTGLDNYMVGQKFMVTDAETGQLTERDAIDDYGSTTHTIDLIGKNTFNNGLNLDYTVRYHSGDVGVFAYALIGTTPGTEADIENIRQNVMLLASPKVPVRSLTGVVEIGKKSENHDWKIGLDQWHYKIDKFRSEIAMFGQTVEVNPEIIEGTSTTFSEYHNGTENKTALFFTDKWDLAKFVFNFGARFEYQNLRGDYIDNRDVQAEVPYLSNTRTKIKKDFFNKNFVLNAIYKVNSRLGLLAEATYMEQSGHLENYSAGNDPNLKKSSIPGGGLGIYYNHPLFSVVSKATYIKRNEYRATVNFNNESGEVQRPTVSYDIETIGWTTDVLVTPSKNFNLHLLFTLQKPKYKNYSGTVDFETSEDRPFDYSDKIVAGIPRKLIEIDPGYQWDKLRIWASARYFSEQYANLNNTLTFKGRWETFAGLNYALYKNFELSTTFVNLFNQRGAQGTISGADLYTESEARNMEGRILSGNYIRPFTVEFGVKYKF